METFIIVLLLVLIILHFSNKSGVTQLLSDLREAVVLMGREMQQLRKELKELQTRDISTWAPKAPPKEEAAPPKPAEAPLPQRQPPLPSPEFPATPPPVTPVMPAPPSAPRPIPEMVRQAPPVQPPTPPPPPFEERESWFDKWFRNNPDLEKFIGENLINKIGIAILVLGIGFFVKYAIDQDWIKEGGRVCIGLLCGAGLVGVAHYLRNGYRAFSSVLAGGGLAVFYFTIAFSFQEYHLMSQTAAFGIMVLITGFAVVLALLYDKLELAVIAAIGGFITPFLVSTGEGNYIVLFTYLIILNIGMLALAYFKRWPLLHVISLFFTVLIYGAWMTDALMHSKPFSTPAALGFATAFYLIFLTMNMIHPVRKGQPFRPFDFTLLLVTTATYFSAGMVLLHYWNGGAYQGLFTLSLGVLNLGLAWYFFRRSEADRNLLYLLIGLTLTFISLAVPVQLHGHTITLFWSAEFVLLYWLHQRSKIGLLKLSATLIAALTLISLLMDWQQAGSMSAANLAVIYNNIQGIVTNLVVAASFTGFFLLLRKEEKDAVYFGEVSNSSMKVMALCVSGMILYFTCIFGVNLYFGKLTSYDVPNAWHRLITEIFIAVLLFFLRKRKDSVLTWLQLFVIFIGFLAYVFSTPLVGNLRDGVLAHRYAGGHLAVHWIACLLLLYLLWQGISTIRSRPDLFSSSHKSFAWLISLVLLVFFSLELLHIYVTVGFRGNNIRGLEYQYGKAALTVLWGICSFALMWLGMKHKYKTLRIISLSLFGAALAKLFLFDISGISEGGKIIAFILLGVLLLTISFMYQKLKKIIIDDPKE